MQNCTFVGNLAKTPVQQGNGDKVVVRFDLLSNEYAGKDKETGEYKQRVVSIPFTAFGSKAESIAKNAMVGDQLIVAFRIENNLYQKNGEDVYGYNFIIESFEFGAAGKRKREAMASGTGQ